MEIKFIGAAGTVTGSMHMIKVNGKTFLLDCGLYQGKRKEAFEINRNFGLFKPKDIDFVILSHAHIDHSGNLPSLIRKGFEGPIYSTFATRDLSQVMLRDSGHIQERDVEFVNKKRKKNGQNLFEPLYTEKDAIHTIEHFVGVNYRREFEIGDNITLTFYDAGHILGSSIVHLKIKENGKTISFGFSGDLGRPNLPILKDPEMIPDVDLFLCESTYGGRLHDNPLDSEQQLADVIKKAVNTKAKIIVPSFSVGRTQEIVYSLNKIFDSGAAERIPVFVDSPLSVNATAVFRMHPECFDIETSQFMQKHEDPFGFNKLTYITDTDESKQLNEHPGPCMIISSSGMCEAGRIQHHLANNIQNKKNIILIVGFQAEHTLGRKLVNNESPVSILGEKYNIEAEVKVLNSFSGHADANDLKNYCGRLDKNKLKNFFIVHGEQEQQEIFKTTLTGMGFNNIHIPAKGDTFTI